MTAINFFLRKTCIPFLIGLLFFFAAQSCLYAENNGIEKYFRDVKTRTNDPEKDVQTSSSKNAPKHSETQTHDKTKSLKKTVSNKDQKQGFMSLFSRNGRDKEVDKRAEERKRRRIRQEAERLARLQIKKIQGEKPIPDKKAVRVKDEKQKQAKSSKEKLAQKTAEAPRVEMPVTQKIEKEKTEEPQTAKKEQTFRIEKRIEAQEPKPAREVKPRKKVSPEDEERQYAKATELYNEAEVLYIEGQYLEAQKKIKQIDNISPYYSGEEE